MIALGIDPGSHRTGWGVIEAVGSQLRCLGTGVIVAPDEDLPARVEPIFRGLETVLAQHRPEQVFVESLFQHKNARSALVLGHARGVAILAARLFGAPIHEISPAEVKKAVAGNGRATKEQVQQMVRTLLGLRESMQSDAADALAVAIAGANRLRVPELRSARRTR